MGINSTPHNLYTITPKIKLNLCLLDYLYNKILPSFSCGEAMRPRQPGLAYGPVLCSTLLPYGRRWNKQYNGRHRRKACSCIFRRPRLLYATSGPHLLTLAPPLLAKLAGTASNHRVAGLARPALTLGMQCRRPINIIWNSMEAIFPLVELYRRGLRPPGGTQWEN